MTRWSPLKVRAMRGRTAMPSSLMLVQPDLLACHPPKRIALISILVRPSYRCCMVKESLSEKYVWRIIPTLCA